MNYYLLRIIALENSFSIAEAGREVIYKYNSAVSRDVFQNIEAGDVVLGYVVRDAKVKYVFKVISSEENDSFVLYKFLEVSQGVIIANNLKDNIEHNELVNLTKEEFDCIYSQFINVLDLPIENSKLIVKEGEEKDYSLEELGQFLSRMYNSPDVNNKTTAIHMFGLKYGKQIKRHNYTATALVGAAGINESYHAEISKGVRIFESIQADEYGVKFYEGEKAENEAVAPRHLPKRSPRVGKIHPFNCILYGAPGTGKTYSTPEYALAIVKNCEVNKTERTGEQRKQLLEEYNKLIEEGRIVFTTFHQNYGYEDFIQGIRPDTSKDGISFKHVDGVFKQIVDRAIKDQENDYVIIIDEINRANISKVFGELITLIEDDKRWGELNETSATLPSGELFAVPNNLYIVGTMNSSDKSISLIDAALRRRFEFIEQRPNGQLVKDAKVKSVFEKLNFKLVSELDSTDLLIGHSYFIGKTENDLQVILNNKIIPLLYEYFYDNRKKVANILSEILKDTNIEVVDEKFGRLSVKKK